MRNASIAIILGVILYSIGIDAKLATLSRIAVATFARSLDIPVAATAEEVILGDVVLTWTEACSGVSALVVFLGSVAWTGCREELGPFLIRVALCLPAALAANFCRIVTLAGLRWYLAPNWEGEQLHFFIGFLSVIPFLPLLASNFRSTFRKQWFEVLYLAVVLSLLSIQMSAPGGGIVAACTLICLARGALGERRLPRSWFHSLIWVTAGLPIAWGNMESLWLPWILSCPRLADGKFLLSIGGVAILAGTVPLIAMQWLTPLIVLPLIVAYTYPLLVQHGRMKHTPAPVSKVSLTAMQRAAIVPVMMFPFVLPELLALEHPPETPPKNLMAKQVLPSGYRVRTAGQPNDIVVYWYGNLTDGRHHSLRTCLRFRGMETESVPGHAEFIQANQKWMREFFIHNNQLLEGYSQYLFSSFSPLSPPGIHIIVQSPSHRIDSDYFHEESERVVNSIFKTYSTSNRTGTTQAHHVD
jgi:exosortase/archaeosortase family protein